MRFSTVSINDIAARAGALLVAIALGFAGFGYWALVAGALAVPAMVAIGAWVQCRWIPGLPRRVPGTGEMVRFALNIYGRFSFNYFARNTDNLLVGWRFGSSALGFYKKAYDLFLLPAGQLSSPLTSVAVSALSRLDRGSEQYRRYFLRILAVMAFVGMGVGADLTLIGKDVILLVLGPAWAPAGRIFMFFGPGVGIMLIYNTHGWLHLSIGTAHRWFRWVVVEFIVTAALFLLGCIGDLRASLPPGRSRSGFSLFPPSGMPETDRFRRWSRDCRRLEIHSGGVACGWRIGSDPQKRAGVCGNAGLGWGSYPHGDGLYFVGNPVSDCGCRPPRWDGALVQFRGLLLEMLPWRNIQGTTRWLPRQLPRRKPRLPEERKQWSRSVSPWSRAPATLVPPTS